MGIEIELVEGVRGDLATVFQILLNNPDEETPPTLAQAKKAIGNGLFPPAALLRGSGDAEGNVVNGADGDPSEALVGSSKDVHP